MFLAYKFIRNCKRDTLKPVKVSNFLPIHRSFSLDQKPGSFKKRRNNQKTPCFIYINWIFSFFFVLPCFVYLIHF